MKEYFNETEFNCLKPMYLGHPDRCYQNQKLCWQQNHIPFFGYLASQYQRGFLDAFDVIFNRYMRRKLIAMPEEMKAFYDLWFKKHPETKSSRYIKNTLSTYCFSGAYFNKNLGSEGVVCKVYLGDYPLFHGRPEDIKKQCIEKQIISGALFTIQSLRYL